MAPGKVGRGQLDNKVTKDVEYLLALWLNVELEVSPERIRPCWAKGNFSVDKLEGNVP